MLILLRIIFGLLLAAAFREAWRNGQQNLQSGDLLNAYYVAVCVVLAVLNAIVWAPYFGKILSDPITGTITGSTYVERKNRLLKWIYRLQERRWRRLALCFCFLEGIRRPDLPSAFIIGMKLARPGSWLEKVFAREVFRFQNIQNCVEAYRTLRWHGIDPRPHANAEINIALLALEKGVKPDPKPVPIVKAESLARLPRNSRIRLPHLPGTEVQGPGEEPQIEAPPSTPEPSAPHSSGTPPILPPPSERRNRRWFDRLRPRHTP
jgi:hypothetical protein